MCYGIRICRICIASGAVSNIYFVKMTTANKYNNQSKMGYLIFDGKLRMQFNKSHNVQMPTQMNNTYTQLGLS